MGDWQVGDLALCIHDGRCTHCGSPAGVVKGRVYRVSGINVNPDRLTLSLEGVEDITGPGHFPGHVTDRFRKIRPDEHEACEPEFVTLLESIRHKRIKEHVAFINDFYGVRKAEQLARENARG